MGCHRVMSDFAFPKHKDIPTRLPKQPEIFTIADSILFKFRTPKLEFRFWEPCEWAATTMAVPKTSMDEDDFVPGGENEVGLPGQIAAMKPVAETEGVDQPPDHHFWSSVFRADPAHSLGTLLWRQRIHHLNSVPALDSGVGSPRSVRAARIQIWAWANMGQAALATMTISAQVATMAP